MDSYIASAELEKYEKSLMSILLAGKSKVDADDSIAKELPVSWGLKSGSVKDLGKFSEKLSLEHG